MLFCTEIGFTEYQTCGKFLFAPGRTSLIERTVQTCKVFAYFVFPVNINELCQLHFVLYTTKQKMSADTEDNNEKRWPRL